MHEGAAMKYSSSLAALIEINGEEVACITQRNKSKTFWEILHTESQRHTPFRDQVVELS